MELLIIPIVILAVWFGGKMFIFIMRLGIPFNSPEYEQSGNPNVTVYPAIKGQRIGTFETSAEARDICENLNQNGDRMYVVGKDILCDNRIDLSQVRKAMGSLHDDYWRVH